MKLFSLLILLCFLVPATILAQEVDTTNAVLPDISPTEVEIRGQLEISFPSIQRQPLIGFNPPPRVPEVPEDRIPFVEDYKQSSARLNALNIGRPDAPEVQYLTGEPVDGELEVSVGRYLTRHVRARMGIPVGDRGILYTSVDYDGSEGFNVADSISSLKNPHDATQGVLGLMQRGRLLAGGVELDGAVDTYTLYGTNFIEDNQLINETILPDRVGRKLGMSLWLRSQSTSIADMEFRVRGSQSTLDTDVYDATLSPLPDINWEERRLEASGRLRIPIGFGDYLLSGFYSPAALSIEEFFNPDIYSIDAATGFRFSGGDRLSLTLTARYISFTPLNNRALSYLTGDVIFDFFPTPGFALYAYNRPGIDTNTLWDQYRNSPFLIDQPQMQSTIRHIDSEAGFRIFNGGFQFNAYGGYLESPNYRFFENEPEPPGTDYSYRRALFNVQYRDVRIIKGGVNMSLLLASALHGKLGVEYRYAELTESNNQPLPYFSPIVVESMLSYSFLERKALMQILGTFNSSRHRSRFENNKIDGYVDIDLSFTYRLNPSVGVVARFDNITGVRLEHWEHYLQAPYAISAGLKINW